MILELSYKNIIEFSGDAESTELPLIVGGMSVRSGFIENKNFIIPDRELDNIAKTLKKGVDGLGAYILKDHGYEGGLGSPKSVDKLVGRVKDAKVVENTVVYSGEIGDEELAEKIRSKMVTTSSVGLHVRKLYCSICNEPYGECMHRLGEIYEDESLSKWAAPYESEMGGVRAAIVGADIEGREQSIVLFPAIPGASIGADFSEKSIQMIEEIENKKVEVDGDETDGDYTLEDLVNVVIAEKDEKIKELLFKAEGFDALEAMLANALKEIRELGSNNATMQKMIWILTKTDDMFAKSLTAEKIKETSMKGIKELYEFYLDIKEEYQEVGHGGQGRPGLDRPWVVEDAKKEDIREVIFGTRRDGKKTGKVKSLKDINIEGRR